MKHLTFEELCQTNCEEVVAIVSGYMERSLIGDYFQPLSGKREITFDLWNDDDPLLYNPSFWFDDEYNETFYEENGKYYCNEPSISCRRYDE